MGATIRTGLYVCKQGTQKKWRAYNPNVQKGIMVINEMCEPIVDYLKMLQDHFRKLLYFEILQDDLRLPKWGI